jgi:hypothetical protein
MEKDPNQTNIILIAGAGLLIFLTGLSFLFFRDIVSKNIRYFLPLPPIGVAAYVYVNHFYQHNNGDIPVKVTDFFKEVFTSIGIASISFAFFVVLLILFVDTVRKYI